MPRYTVDVKALINITVNADSADQAREIADSYVVDGLSPDEFGLENWNWSLKHNGETAEVRSTGSFTVDGESEVEKL